MVNNLNRITKVVTALIFCLTASLVAEDNNGTGKNALAALDECSRTLMRTFFPEEVVNNTLKKYNIPQTQWSVITADLATKNKEILSLVAERAAKIDPNPLTNPQERQAGLKLFRDTLFEVFSNTLKSHGISDEETIQGMFNDIREQNARNFGQCLKSKITQFSAPAETAPK